MSSENEPVTCVLASGNQGKLAELSNALTSLGITLVSQSEYKVSEADETASSFVENALIKARHASEVTGLPALADDSGLVVPALKGAPGIHSARYAASDDCKPTDQDNIDKLLRELAPLTAEQRSAYFVCTLVYLRHDSDPEPVIATGLWHGHILQQSDGNGGFGYDPVFYCPQQKMSAASMGSEKKKTISHRAIALAKLTPMLANSVL